jgi:hypothetical protein
MASSASLLELTSPRREQPLLVESSPTDDHGHESEHIRWVNSRHIPQRTMAGGLGRPPSYSDSFLVSGPNPTSFFLKDLSTSALAVCQESKDATTQTDLEGGQGSVASGRLGKRFLGVNFGPIFKRTGSFLFHVWLISIFETVFFFAFISKSEDQGILKTVDHYIFSVTNACSQWSPNTTAFVNEILPALVNSSDIATEASQALTQRNATNEKLLIQAWMYVVGIASLLVGAGAVAWWKRLLTRRNVVKILLENFGLVALLGIYEFVFFRTIIYNYEALSASEISGDAIQTLRAGCGLFV